MFLLTKIDLGSLSGSDDAGDILMKMAVQILIERVEDAMAERGLV